MFKYFTPRIAISFTIGMTVYAVILLLVVLDPEDVESRIFGQALNILLYIAPFLIVGETLMEVLKERKRQKDGIEPEGKSND